MLNSCDEVYQKIRELKDYEPVPGDFLMKKTGIDIIGKFVNLTDQGVGLEIGCGSGVNSAFLSSSARGIVATDLPHYDGRTHSLGIAIAKNLLGRSGIRNVALVSCSGESLPFPDNSFDFVFSSSVLEHISDKEKALREMLRVVRPGGAVLFIVPTYIQSILSFAHLYLYTARRILDVINTRIFGKDWGGEKGLLPKKDDASRKNASILKSFRDNHPSLPFPEPHGSYRNVFEEFVSQLPWNWTALARRCGSRKTETFAFMFLPFNILEVFSTRAIARLYSDTKRLHCLAARSPLKYFSYSYCVVAKK